MLRSLIEKELARAEAVLFDAENGKKALHGPTVDNHKGQRIAYRKVLSYLELEKITPPIRFEISRTLHMNLTWPWLAFAAICIIIWYIK